MLSKTAPSGTPFTLLPGASLPIVVPAGQSDVIVVTFSAESRLFFAGLDDRMILQIRANGFPLPPSNLSELTFKGDNSYSSNATQVCLRLAGGLYTIQVYWALSDAGSNNLLRGWLDDWTLKVERFQ